MSNPAPKRSAAKQIFRFRGQELSASRIRHIREMVRTHRKVTRCALAKKICQRFGWRRPNGELRHDACRVLLLRMESAGVLRLPAKRRQGGSGQKVRQKHRSPQILPEAPTVLTIAFCDVKVRPIWASELERWRDLMSRYHYLGDGAMVGERIRYVAEIEGTWLALLGWGGAALHNRPRDANIGWDYSMKVRRLHMITNNVRFLILPWVRVPNLASHVLGKNLRRLNQDWEQRYSHRILLAETFVDGERYRGTCYRAANWTFLGQTQGMGRRGTSYVHHGHPKDVWTYPFEPRALEKLSAHFSGPETMEEQRMASQTIDVNRLPLEGEGGLLELLHKLTDPRKKRGIRHPFDSVLALSIMAVLSGMRSYEAISEWASEVPNELLRRLDCWRRQAPSESTFRRVLSKANASEIDEKVGKWLEKQVSLKGVGVALDGKVLRGSRDGEKPGRHLLSVLTHQEGIVVGQREVGEKTNEIPESKPLLEPLALEGAVVTADALHTQTKFAQNVVENKKADYVLIAKENQPTLLEDIRTVPWGSFSPSGHHE